MSTYVANGVAALELSAGSRKGKTQNIKWSVQHNCVLFNSYLHVSA